MVDAEVAFTVICPAGTTRQLGCNPGICNHGRVQLLLSSFEMVPRPWASDTVAPVTLLTFTKKVSLGSNRYVAIYGNSKIIRQAASRYGLAGQRFRYIISISSGGGIVCRSNIKGYAASRCGEERLTVKLKLELPLLPSFCVTSFMESDGITTGALYLYITCVAVVISLLSVTAAMGSLATLL